MELKGTVALVTGAGKRIGRAIALELARADARIAVHTNSSTAEAQGVADEINGAGGTARVFTADFNDSDATAKLITYIKNELGVVRVLVNSAAIFPAGIFQETSVESMRAAMKINLETPFVLAQRMFAELAEPLTGKVINIGDWHTARKARFAYGVSKSALSGLTRSLAVAMAPRVQVNQLDLGAILPPADGDLAERSKTNRSLSGRLGTPQEVAQAVLALIANDYITGQSLVVDGGLSLR